MEIVEKHENGNQICGFKPKLVNSHIKFHGKNNRLICEKNVTLVNTIIDFDGDNSIIYLSSNRHKYILKISIPNNSVCFIDENNYINGTLYLSLSEEKHIFIGKECMFSFGVWFRVADAHLLYDINTKERLNLSKSIYLGDHVWVGQDAMILKGTQIGSGSIVGAKSLVSNKIINSNTSWGGNPATELKDQIFYDSSSVHKYTEKETEKSLYSDKEDYIYRNEGEILSFDVIDDNFSSIKDVDEKVKYIQSIRNNKSHNRFYIDDDIKEEQFMAIIEKEFKELKNDN